MKPARLQAELKGMHSPDVDDLSVFQPADPTNFGFLLQAFVGPKGEDGYESFDMIVCTPTWFAQEMTSSIVFVRHYTFMRAYDFDELRRHLEELCSTVSGVEWRQVAEKLGRIGKWEFEDYNPTPLLSREDLAEMAEIARRDPALAASLLNSDTPPSVTE